MKSLEEKLKILFIASINGDQKAYRLFLTQLSHILRRIISRKISSEDSEDVLQEILISIDKAKHTYDGIRPLMPWLGAIINFRINDQLRKNYSNMSYSHVDITELENILSDVTNDHNQNEYIDDIMSYVNDKERKIIALMHIQGFNAKEVGSKLGMTESAVKVAAHRSYKKIRERFKND